MASLLITIESAELSVAALRDRFDKSWNKRRMMRELIAYLQAGMSGHVPLYLNVAIASAHASATVTCDQSSAVEATDELVVAGTTLAVEEAPADEDEFLLGDTDNEFAANLAECINAHSVLSKLVRASVVDAVVTITSKTPGPVGNLITLTEAGGGMALSGAALSGGASDEVDALPFGYDPTV